MIQILGSVCSCIGIAMPLTPRCAHLKVLEWILQKDTAQECVSRLLDLGSDQALCFVEDAVSNGAVAVIASQAASGPIDTAFSG